jgi:hypothetical protein
MQYETTLEKKVIRKFFLKRKRDRSMYFLNSAKRRAEFTNGLAHCNDLIFENFIEVTAGNEMQQIKSHISKLGKIKDCYILSENEELDGKRIDIDIALSETIGHCLGTLLIFGDAEIVYYEGESPKNRWISKL